MTNATAIPARIWTWDELCELGRKYRAQLDTFRWNLGDLAAYVTSRATDDAKTLTEFCAEIDIKYKTLAQYRKVAEFYPVERRAEFIRDNPHLTYTHYRDAMRLEDLDRAYDFLEHAATELWTAAQSERELILQLGEATVTGKLFERVVTVRRNGNFVTFECDAVIVPDKAYRVTISEA